VRQVAFHETLLLYHREGYLRNLEIYSLGLALSIAPLGPPLQLMQAVRRLAVTIGTIEDFDRICVIVAAVCNVNELSICFPSQQPDGNLPRHSEVLAGLLQKHTLTDINQNLETLHLQNVGFDLDIPDDAWEDSDVYEARFSFDDLKELRLEDRINAGKLSKRLFAHELTNLEAFYMIRANDFQSIRGNIPISDILHGVKSLHTLLASYVRTGAGEAHFCRTDLLEQASTLKYLYLDDVREEATRIFVSGPSPNDDHLSKDTNQPYSMHIIESVLPQLAILLPNFSVNDTQYDISTMVWLSLRPRTRSISSFLPLTA